MNCTWSSPTLCINIFKAVHHTNPMVNITFDSQGLHIMSMDMGKTSLVQLELTPGTFETFSCLTPITIGLYTETLVTILNKAKNSQLRWKSTDAHTLSIVLSNGDQTTEFQLRAIDIDEDRLDVPELDDDIALQVTDSVLREWMDKVLMTKEDVQFQISDSIFQCSSSAIELGTITHREPMNGLRIVSLATRSNVDITLSFQAAKSMLVFSRCGDVCMVGFSNQQPSRLKVNLDNGSYLCLYVAPKVS